MDVYEVLFQRCLEHTVVVDGREVPLWAVSREDIEGDRVDFRLQWRNLQDLVIFLCGLRDKHIEQERKIEPTPLVKFPIEEILIGIAFLKPSECLTDPRLACIEYLSYIITARVDYLSKHYFQAKKPLNTTIFDEVILKFPQKKNLRNNITDLKKIVNKLRNLEFDM
ncbi:MAG TPA: hypothetical protein EYH55_03605 [Methanothermococcus okinawensis]|uniref:GINS subunit domain-containing protein n=1 Tax=Methanothermococcus okinawensis TaxID=155863 RepID=A0A832ZYP5_9EURY|nr:hypothetical protein [Methanothermococcus okinawensis]